MDDRLRLIQFLYGEDPSDPSFSRRLAEDENLREEYEELLETKERLDRRPSRSPDDAVVDRIVEEADAAAPEPAPMRKASTDRSARAPSRSWSRRLQGASAALALVLVIGLGWWQESGPDSAATDSTPTATQAPSQQPAPVSATQRSSLESDAIPAWDDSEELVRIQRRIERLRARSSTNDWDGLQTVGQTRP